MITFEDIKAFMNKISHLHTHSHYSLLSALPKVPELVKAAKENEMPALALTDSGNMYGAIEFYKECKSAGIKPIIGVDTYVAQRSRFDKQRGIDASRTRIILLAENKTGYQNLLKIVTASYIEGFYYKPRVDMELLKEHHEGLIAIMPAMGGALSNALRMSDTAKAKEIAEKYRGIFGKENFFAEITLHPEMAGHDERMAGLVSFAKEHGLPIVASHDVFYMHPEDKPARDTLLSVQSSGGRSDRANLDEDEDSSFISSDELQKRFEKYPEAAANNARLVERINLELELGSWVFPLFDMPEGKTADEALRDIVYKGIERRGIKETPEIKERIEYELKIIGEKKFSPYFLVVGDLLRFAHENGILTNIRGSVAGSMVTFLAGITDLHPIEYGLPFERFLNPDRPSAPDIDMDFADNRRDEVIEYARQKYGNDKVAQIGTFGTMMARGSVRDVARALNFSYQKGDEIAKLIPMGSQGFPMTIERALEITPELKALYEKDRETKTIIDMAKKIEGCARHISVHAAGVVIAPSDIRDFTPLQYDTKGENKLITQYDMYSIEEAGLLKFDFLGLRNLSIIADTIDRIRAIENIELKIDQVPLDDKKTFEMLARGETEGLFQLNGEAMTKFLMELKPSTIHDINAMVALYRPGPMQFIPLYIECKHNPELVSYLDPALKPILEKSYGVLVYQDDLLMIARDIAGYSWGEVDKFRKAVGKKIPEEMAAQKEKFIKGCVEHSGWEESKAKELWSWIEPFAAYGFNKAHSASYGRVAYHTAYLKANFPAIYMSASLTAESGNMDTIALYIAESKRMGIPVLPPSVNESFSGFSVVREEGKPDTIRFGLTTIKNFGAGIAQSIVHERKRGGKFTSLADFLTRIPDKNLNKKSLEALIKAGALDNFDERGKMFANIDLLLQFHKESADRGDSQDSLFSNVEGHEELRLADSPPAEMDERLAWEKDLLGLYISGHPLEKYRERIQKTGTTVEKIISDAPDSSVTLVAGIIDSVREVTTKKGDLMAFGALSDFTGTIEVVAFSRIYAEMKEILKPDNCVVIKGKVSVRNGEKSIVIDEAKIL